MLASAIILFREVLEAALIVAIVMGASRGLPGRGHWVLGGIGLGLLGATLVAALAATATSWLSGDGQAVFNAGILLAAVGMLTWHNVWMSSHAQQLRTELSAVGAQVREGNKPLMALLVVTAAAILREGSEAALFLWALMAGGGSGTEMVIGGIAGLAAGVMAGVLLYRGLLRIPVRHFFTVTRWLLLFIAAGLSAQAAGFLNQAGWVPALGQGVWNTSQWLDQNSLTGQLMHILVGYMAKPTGIQVLFYGVTLLGILTLMYLPQKLRKPAQ